MKSKLLIAAGVLFLTMGLFVGVVGAQNDAATQGALLYDKWWGVTGADAPTTDHPLWATQSSNTRSGKDTWRCKECHGWDYKGVDGAYGSGSHMTGFAGVYDSRTKSVDELVAALKGGTNADHDFSAVMDDTALNNLAAFIQGVQDDSLYIDYDAKTALNGNAGKGAVLYEDTCAKCHGADGTELNFHTPEDPEYVGTVAAGNPQEFFHKAIYGQPGSDPAMIGGLEAGWSLDQIANVLAYAQTLPTGAADAAPATLPATGGVPFNPSWLLMLGGVASLGIGLLGLRKKA